MFYYLVFAFIAADVIAYVLRTPASKCKEDRP